MANFNLLRKQSYNFDQKFSSLQSSNEFVGESFILNGSTKKLTFNGISESNSDITVQIRLVNEQTNEVSESTVLNLYNNDKNFASGNNIEFCKISSGTYHFVFVTNSRNSSPIDYSIDYKVVHGGVSFSPLFTIAFILIIILFYYYIQTGANLPSEADFSINNILSIKKFKIVLIVTILLFGAISLYKNFMKECKVTSNANTLEDNTYTGSRNHYYRRSYFSDGSGHK